MIDKLSFSQLFCVVCIVIVSIEQENVQKIEIYVYIDGKMVAQILILKT